MSKFVSFGNQNNQQQAKLQDNIANNNADKIIQSANNNKMVFYDGSKKQQEQASSNQNTNYLDAISGGIASAAEPFLKSIPNTILDGIGSIMQLPDKAYGTYATWFEKSMLGNKDYNYENDPTRDITKWINPVQALAEPGKIVKDFDFGGATAISDEDRKKHWLSVGVGEGLGQLIPLAISGGVGAAAKAPQAAKLFSMASIYASETMGYVDRYEKDTGESIVNNPTQFAAANAYGAIASALERMGLNPYNLSGNTARQGVRKAIDELITSPLLTEKAIKESTKTVGQVVSDVVKKMIGEGVQEASQTLAEEVVARGANTISDKKIVESDSLMQDMIQSAVIGGLVGGIVDTGRNLPKSARTYHENALFDYIHNGADVGTQLMENPTVADKVKASVVEAEPETKNKRIDNVFKVIQNANVDEDSKAKALESLSYMTKISDMLDRDSSTSEPTKAFDYIKKIEAINNEINFYNNDAPSIVKEINSDKIKSLQSLKNEYVNAINQKDLNVDETAITKKYNNISKFINENITELGDETNQNKAIKQESPQFVELSNSEVKIPVSSLANESRTLPSGNIAVKDNNGDYVFLKKIETPDRYEKITKDIAGEKFEENVLVEPASIKYEVANTVSQNDESYQAFSDKFSELPKYTESAVNNAKQQTTGAKSDVKEVSLSNSLSEVLTESDNPTTLENKGISVGTEIYSNRGDFKISKIEGSGQDLKIYYNKIVNGVPEGGMSQLKNPSLFYLKKSTPVPLVSTKTEVSKNNETQPKEKTNPLKRGGETKSLSEAFDGVDKNTTKEFTNFLFNRILPLLKFYYEDGKNIGRKFPVGLRIALDDNTKNRFDGNSRKKFVEVLEKLKSREVDENSDIFIGKEFDAIKYLLDKFKNKEQIKFRFGNIGNFNADQEGAFLEGTKTPYRGNLFLSIETINNAFTKLKEIVKELYGTENPLGEEGAFIQVALAWATLNQKIVNIDSVDIDEDTLNTALEKTANREEDNITKSKIASDVVSESINNEKKRDNTIINILSKYQGKKGTSTFIKNNTIRNVVGFLEYVELIARKPLDAINEGEINILSLAHEFEQYLINYNYEKTNGPNSSNDETNVSINIDSKVSTETNIQTTSDKLFKGDGDVLFSNSKIGRKLSEIRDAGIAKSIAEKKTEGRSPSVKQTTDRSILEDIANKTISDAPLTDEEYKVFKQNESEINKIILSKKGIQAVSIKEADKAIGQQQKDIAKQDTRTVKEMIIQGTKIRKEDFIDQGDKNQIQGRATAQFFDKNARGIDDIADELSTDGIEITRQDIIDYILDRVANPNKYKGKQNFGEEKVTNASAKDTEVVKEKPYVTFEQITNGRSLKDASLELHGMWFGEQITDENLAEVEKQIQDAIAKESTNNIETAQPKIDKEQLRLDTIEEVSTRDGELDARKIQSTLSDLNRYYPNLLEILDNKKTALANETDEAKKIELQKEVDSTSITVQKQDEKKKILLELANKTGIRRSLSVKSTNKNVRKFNKLLKALSNFKGFRGVIHSDENKLSKALEIRQLRMPDGVVYGATYLNENGVREIYINRDNISLETPIHEYFHPYLEMLYLSEDTNAKAAIESFEKYAKDLGYVEKIKSNKDYADLSEKEVMKEAITTMVGEIGADKLQQPENIREKLRNLFRTALQWISSKFGLSISQYKVEDISKLSASDLVLASLASAKKGEFYQDITGDELNLSTNPKFRMDKGPDIKEESNVLSPFLFSEISNNILRKFTQTQISDAFKVFANQDNKITKGLLKGLSPSVVFSNQNYEELITLLQNGDPSFSYAKRIIPSLTQEEFDLRYGVLDYFEDEKNYHKAFSKNFIVSNGRVLDISNDYESIKKQLDIVNLFIIPKRLLDGKTILELLGKKGQAFYDFFTAGFTELREKSSKFSILLTEKEQKISDLGKGLIITGTTDDNATEYDSLRKLSIERLVDDKSEKLDISVGEAISLLLTHDYQIQNNGESYLSVGPVDSTESVDSQSGVFIENPNFKGVITMSDKAIEELRDKLKPYQDLIDKVKDFYHGQEAMEMYKQINESLINTTGKKSEIYDGFIPINKRTAKTASEKLAAKSVNAFESLSFNFNQKANGQIQVKDIGVDLNLMASYANIGLKSIPMQETYRKYYDIIKDKKDFPESIKGWFEDRLKYGYIESPNTSNLEQFLQSARAASIFSLRVLGTATQYTGLAKGYASTVIKSKYLKVELRMYADMFLGTKALNRIKDGILREKSSNIVEWTSADWEKYTSKEVAQIISEIKANNSVLYDRFLNQMIYMQDAVRKNKGYVPEVSLSTSKDDLSDIANKKFGAQATKLKEKWIDKNLRYLLSGIYWGDAMAVIAMTKAAKRQAAAEGHDLKFAMELALAAVEETQVMDDDFYKSNYTIISRGDSSESFALRQLMAFQQESQQLSNMVLTSYIRKQKNINSYNGDSASTALNKTIGYGVVVGAVSFGLVQLLRGALLKSPCTKTNIYKNAVAGVTQNMLALQPFSPIVNAAVQYPENKLLKMAGVDIYNPNDYGNILGVLKEPLQVSKELPEGKYKSVVKTMITMFGVPGDIAKFIVDCISK